MQDSMQKTRLIDWTTRTFFKPVYSHTVDSPRTYASTILLIPQNTEVETNKITSQQLLKTRILCTQKQYPAKYYENEMCGSNTFIYGQLHTWFEFTTSKSFWDTFSQVITMQFYIENPILKLTEFKIEQLPEIKNSIITTQVKKSLIYASLWGKMIEKYHLKV